MAENMIGAYTEQEFKRIMTANLLRVDNSLGSAVEGISQTVDFTTQIMSKVLETDFYELNGQKLSDFTPIEAGFGAFSTEIMQLATQGHGTDFKSCLINPTGGALNQDGYTDIEIGSQKYANNFFRDTYSITKEGSAIAERAVVPFNLLEQKEKARKKKFDLGLQEAWFLGLGDGKSYGLLNAPNAVVNTSYLPAKIKNMTDAQFTAFVAGLRGLYNAQTASTANFDRLCLAQDDYFALDAVYGQFGMTRRQILEDVVKANNGKIVYTTYNETAGTGGGVRYALYKADPDYIEGFLPLPYTPFPLYPTNSLDMISNSMAQFVTPVVKRTNTMLYLDIA